MKKIFTTILVAIIAINFCTAQDNDKVKTINQTDFRERIMFGLKLGTNHSNVYDQQNGDYVAKAKFGVAAGAFLAIPIGKLIGIQPELLFSQKGYKATGTLLGSTYSLTRTTSYLDVPIQFAFKPSEFITVLAGPQYSFLINQNDAFKNGTTTIQQEKEFENSNIRKNTFCFTSGIDLTMKQLVLSGRFGFDLMNNNGDGSATTPRYKNMWYQATVGYRF